MSRLDDTLDLMEPLGSLADRIRGFLML